jgi:nucleotide sugar dehydrogenase
MSLAIKQLLIDGKARIGTWGCGYIGLTTMINFAKEGIYCLGYDANQNVLDSLSRGELHIPTLDYWLGYKPDFFLMRMIKPASKWADMLADDVKVHLIAVPTERYGEPWAEPLKDVIKKIRERKPTAENPDLVIIESTLTSGWFGGIVVKLLEEAGLKVGKDILVGIAPRRDWFDSPEKNLKELARVIGGTTPETCEAMKEVLGIICDHLIVVPDTNIVELVKAVENSILHVCSAYACQLASAYPDVDMGEVFRLASTHWRIPLYYPSVGTGGYCIPLSSKYIRDGAPHPEYLKITEEVIHSDEIQPLFVAGIMSKKTRCGSIAMLGLSYKRDLKVHTLSPALRIIEGLRVLGIDVRAFDPYYTDLETYQIAGVKSFSYPEGLSQFAGIIIVPPHRMFGQTPKDVLFKHVRKGQVILDNEGIWEKWRNDFVSSGVDYHRVGDKGWCL